MILQYFLKKFLNGDRLNVHVVLKDKKNEMVVNYEN